MQTARRLPPPRTDALRPRVIIMSDFSPVDVIPVGAGSGPAENRSNPDDVQSMVRFLLYANEFAAQEDFARRTTWMQDPQP